MNVIKLLKNVIPPSLDLIENAKYPASSVNLFQKSGATEINFLRWFHDQIQIFSLEPYQDYNEYEYDECICSEADLWDRDVHLTASSAMKIASSFENYFGEESAWAMKALLKTPPPAPPSNEPSEIDKMLDQLFRLERASLKIYQRCRYESYLLDASEDVHQQMVNSMECAEAYSEHKLRDWSIDAVFYDACVENMTTRLRESLARERQKARQMHLAMEKIYCSALYEDAVAQGLAPTLH